MENTEKHMRKFRTQCAMTLSLYLETKMLNSLSHILVICPPVSQTRLMPSPRLKCKSELFQLKETCTD